MGFFSGVKKVVKPFVNVSGWVGYAQLKEVTGWLRNLIKRFFIVAHPEHAESFEQAMTRLKLTEKDLTQRLVEFKRLFIVWICMFALVLIYAAYMVGVGSWGGFIISLSVALLTLTQVFRYHFWMFQIRHRKLGCTWREWWYSRIKSEESQ